MFTGEYQHTLDAKGRLILPAKFRARLESGCVITRGQDQCLSVYTREGWDELSARLAEARLSSQQARMVNRLIFSGAHEEVPDRQGRVTIPEHLRRYARLESDVAVVGTGRRFEIWDRGSWERYQGENEPGFSEIAESIPGVDF